MYEISCAENTKGDGTSPPRSLCWPPPAPGTLWAPPAPHGRSCVLAELREDPAYNHPCPSPRLLWSPTIADGRHPVLFPTVFPLGWGFPSWSPGRSRALVLWPLLASSLHCWCVTMARLRLWRWEMALCSG